MSRPTTLLVALLAAAAACDVTAPDPTCAPLLTTKPIRYVGHVHGDGEVALAPAGGERVEGKLILRGASPGDPVVALAATGTCRGGVAKLRLAAAGVPTAELRVLGGRLVLVHDAELLGHEFGMWRVEVVPKGAAAPRELHGYLRERGEEPLAAR